MGVTYPGNPQYSFDWCIVALDVVQDYDTDARVLLQDQVLPYRYQESEIVEALNVGMLQALRVRPDIFFKLFRSSPVDYTYATTNMSQTVPMDPRYRTPLLYFIVGWVQLRDAEDTQDSRAVALLSKFSQELMGVG